MSKINSAKSNRKFIAGLILTMFWSIVIGALHIVGAFYIFGVPFFGLLLGLFFVWFSQAKIAAKVLLTAAPLPVVLATSLLVFQLNTAESETFLIPQNVRGEIVVFYDETCGQEPVYENGSRIYKISDNGILITKFKENPGYFNQQFYLIDENGNKSKIPQFHWQNFDTEQRNWQHFESTPAIELTKDSVGAFWSYGRETYQLSKKSIGYTISSYRDFEKPENERWLASQQFTKTAKKLLDDCRKSQP